ncbi:MAG TPA: hypothetical protein VM118_06600 [Acidobacteriota bacterium]|nr:hypothetical protein [Acidobacteriota bacterium]
MRHISLAVVALLVGGSTNIHGEPLAISGYYKNFFVVYDAPRIGSVNGNVDTPAAGIVTNRLRLDLRLRGSDNISAHLAYDLVPRVRPRSSLLTLSGSGLFEVPAYRAFDLKRRLYPDQESDVQNIDVIQNLDRVLVTLRTGVADLTFGRQPIAWGSARAVNPTDVLAPFSFDELDVEDRRGVDAVRARVPLGTMSELDVGYVFGDDWAFDQSAFFVSGKAYVARTDLTLMLVGFRENLMVGLDLARAAGDAGLWVEGAYVLTDVFDTDAREDAADYLRVTVGMDYALSGTIYGYAEYHFSEAGAGDPGRYFERLRTPGFTDGAVYLLGRHYFIPGATWAVTPLITWSAQVIVNVEDPSTLLAPQVEYNIAENVYLSAGAFIGLGRGPVEVADPAKIVDITLRSEFGSYTDFFFTSFRAYF